MADTSVGGAGPVTLRMTGVRKRFARPGRWVLDGVDLAAGAGTLTVITGGNGSGKSTLLRIAAGATLATRGRVCGPAGPAAYVPERLPARLRMTASQYLAHMGGMRGLAPGAVAGRSRELLSRLALAPGADVPIGTLSRGNGQKVALAQALLAPVCLLALDEPYGGLDEQALAAAVALVDEAVADGAAVLLTAPEPDVPHRAGARYRLADGRLVAETAGPAPASGTGLASGTRPPDETMAAGGIGPGGGTRLAGETGPGGGTRPPDETMVAGETGSAGGTMTAGKAAQPGRTPQPAGPAQAVSDLSAGSAAAAPDGGPAGSMPASRQGPASEGCVITLVLQAAGPRASADKLAGTPGVLSLDHDAARGTVTVRTSDGDALLRRALRGGWSFRSGGRDAPDGRDPAP